MVKVSREPARVREAWRKDDEGKLDDIVVPDVRMFRMERMDANDWWIGLYLEDGSEIHVDVRAEMDGINAIRREEE